MTSKIIPVTELSELQSAPEFVTDAGPLIGAICGSCKSDRNTMQEINCRYCGAPLRDGYRLVGLLDGVELYVKESEYAERDKPAKATKNARK